MHDDQEHQHEHHEDTQIEYLLELRGDGCVLIYADGVAEHGPYDLGREDIYA